MVRDYRTDSRCELNISEFKNMINSLDEGKNICDKDIILGLYYTLYTMMISPIELINKNVAKEYSEYFNKTMNTVIRLSKARKDMVSVESFIGNFLYYLNSNELSKVSPISDMLDLFKNDLDTFWDEIKRMNNPHKYFVDLSQNLWDLKHHLLNTRGNN